MKKTIANAVQKNTKAAKLRVRLAKVVKAKPSYNKSARQAAFSKLTSHLSVAKVVAQAKLISGVNPAEFRIVRMPG
jgi:hypothetical protein